MLKRNVSNKAESKIEEKECKEDKINQNNNYDVLFKKYMHDIRNLKTLDEEMINNICYMSNEQKMSIIISFNTVVENMKAYLDC
jgi:hypothetical protein